MFKLIEGIGGAYRFAVATMRGGTRADSLNAVEYDVGWG